MKPSTHAFSCVLAVPLMAFSAVGEAHEGQAIEEARLGRMLAGNCAACHGQNGHAQGALPVLAGKSRDYIVEQMQAFKAGTRQETIMHQIAKGYTDKQIGQMAEYFAAQKK